jgi:transcription initiation factor TFIID subunit 1
VQNNVVKSATPPRRFKSNGEVDLEASREAVMKILYPHGVDPPSYVSGGSLGGGGAAGPGGYTRAGGYHGGGGGGGGGGPPKTVSAPNFHGTVDQKDELLRARKRLMERKRRAKKKTAAVAVGGCTS